MKNPSLVGWACCGLLVGGVCGPALAAEDAVSILEDGKTVRITWPLAAEGARGAVEFDMDGTRPLIRSLGVGTADGAVRTIATGLEPLTLLTIGTRDMANVVGWMRFFDNPPQRPHETLPVKLGKREFKVLAEGTTRTTVSVAAASAGTFSGDVRFTFYHGSGLIQAETVMSTPEDGRAIVYDTGLVTATADWRATVWKDTDGRIQRAEPGPAVAATPLKVSGRTIVAESANGSLAVFPAPHRFFYPQDEAFNLQFVWHGTNYGGTGAGYGLGIRQSLEGDKRFVPWFNAPPETEQHLGAFYFLTPAAAEGALDEVAAYTHGDRFKPLPGHKTFTSHYHVEHALEFVHKQREQGTTGVPKGLEVPGMVKTFKARGVNIVHLAEFHVGETPRLPAEERLPLLKTLHEECARLSDDDLLILPGEEPNVHLGGHWISFFPKPVYWVLNRGKETPFVEERPGYGKVYHVGSQEDVLKLMELENGLMWTAHARIKASIGFPDAYRDTDFFKSEHFLGAAWKAMPADLSRPTLGWRVLDLLDDMSNWNARKQAIGECDLFRMEPDFESYAHMNINYVELGSLPAFGDGWQPVLDALRAGKFFTTTGEILLRDFRVAGQPSGGELPAATGEAAVTAAVEWTFPLEEAHIVSGDGAQVFREVVDLRDTGSFGTRQLDLRADLQGRTWVRLELWDIAGNGAFTQPVWIGPRRPVDFAGDALGRPVTAENGYEPVIPTARTAPAEWKYTIARPAEDWARGGFDDSAWKTGKSAFGTETTPGTAGILNTKWSTRDLWIRREVTLPQDLAGDLRLMIHHDNSAEVYIDGVLAWRSVDIETRDYRLFQIRPEALARLKPGAKVTLAAYGHNGLGGQVLDVGLVKLK